MASRTVAHSSALDLLRAIEGQPDADSVRTNHCLGFVFARWLEPFSPPAPSPDKAPGDNDKPDQDAEVLVTVWQGDRLVLIFTKLGWSQSKIVSPVASSDLAAVLPSIPPLVQHLLTVAPFSSAPGLLRSLCGPQTLVDAFLASWPHPRKPSPSMTIIPMSTRSAPSTVVLPDGHSFSRIRDVAQLSLAELNKIGQLLVTFYGNHPSAPRFSPDGLVEHTRAMILRGAFWVYRAPPCEGHEAEPVGFVQTGRPTMRTCAIRMVFVAPSHRGAGVAQRMVSAVVRAHLVEAPRLALDFARTPLEGETEEETTRFGGKDEVCLFVEPGNAAARRVYAQVGMEEGGDLWSCVELGEVEPGHW
ncbi:Proteophosphoglycan [Rhodotorula diobovata]|uniref:Proteophosphoglycan n=1 Tax=Rhodotorula diobovata TaxID=5288 RepID=A0A5C5G161_9BASI|nr:Proteophosphoglycan [Rhodotorula diobovata]